MPRAPGPGTGSGPEREFGRELAERPRGMREVEALRMGQETRVLAQEARHGRRRIIVSRNPRRLSRQLTDAAQGYPSAPEPTAD